MAKPRKPVNSAIASGTSPCNDGPSPTHHLYLTLPHGFIYSRDVPQARTKKGQDRGSSERKVCWSADPPSGLSSLLAWPDIDVALTSTSIKLSRLCHRIVPPVPRWKTRVADLPVSYRLKTDEKKTVCGLAKDERWHLNRLHFNASTLHLGISTSLSQRPNID